MVCGVVPASCLRDEQLCCESGAMSISQQAACNLQPDKLLALVLEGTSCHGNAQEEGDRLNVQGGRVQGCMPAGLGLWAISACPSLPAVQP